MFLRLHIGRGIIISFVGKRIREKRLELKMSLRTLADKAGFTASFLSQMERGLVDPSLKSLRKIAEALGVSLLYFLEDSNKEPLIRKEQHPRLYIKSDNVAYEVLTPNVKRKMDMLVVKLDPSDKNVAYPLGRPTEECILVLEGEILVQLGETEFHLTAGDSIYFEGKRLKKLVALGKETATFVSAITPAVF